MRPKDTCFTSYSWKRWVFQSDQTSANFSKHISVMLFLLMDFAGSSFSSFSFRNHFFMDLVSMLQRRRFGPLTFVKRLQHHSIKLPLDGGHRWGVDILEWGDNNSMVPTCHPTELLMERWSIVMFRDELFNYSQTMARSRSTDTAPRDPSKSRGGFHLEPADMEDQWRCPSHDSRQILWASKGMVIL